MKTLKHLSPIGIPLIFLTLIISGCTFTTSRLNREGDRKDAEKVTDQFYAMIKAKKYDDMYNLFSFKFWAVTSVKKMNGIYTMTQNKLGDIVDMKLGDWQTKVVSGTDPSAEYRLTYNNHRQKFDSRETFLLMKDTDNVIRIVAYDIYSDGFLK
jgi:hypothetical protein